LIDGEESWMQDAADDLVTEMMRKYRKSNCFQYIANVSLIVGLLEKNYMSKPKDGFFIGMKLVRGAYMEKKLFMPKKRISITNMRFKEATDENYDAAVHYMIDNLDLMSILQPYNELSTYTLMELMQEKGIKTNDDRIWFGQLYGMSDYQLQSSC
jgi:proline dehydrogenase